VQRQQPVVSQQEAQQQQPVVSQPAVLPREREPDSVSARQRVQLLKEWALGLLLERLAVPATMG